MPKIPVVQPNPNEGLNTAPLEQAAYRAARRGLQTGADYQQGFEKLGAGLVGMGEELDQHTFTDYAQKSTDFEASEAQRYDEAKQKADPNDPNWLPTYLKDAKDRRADFDSQFNFLTERGEQQRVASSDQWFKETAHAAILDHSQAMANGRVAAAETKINGIAADASEHPELLGMYLGKVDTDVAPLLPYESRQSESQKAKSGIAYSAADNVIRTKVAQADDKPAAVAQFRSLLDDKGGPYVANITPEQRKVLNDELDTIEKTGAGIQFGLLKGELPSLYEAMDRGSPDATKGAQARLDWMAAHASTEAEVLAVADARRDVAQHQAAGQVYQAVSGKYGDIWGDKVAADNATADIDNRLVSLNGEMAKAKTPEESVEIKGQIEALKSTRDMLDSAWKANMTAFNADPYTFAASHDPVTSAAANAYEKAPSPENFAKVAQAQTVFQQRWGRTVPELLPVSLKNNIETQMALIPQTPEGAVQAGKVITDLRDHVGTAFNAVTHELEREHIISGEQFAAAQVMARPEGFALGQEILRATGTPDKDLEATSGVPAMKGERLMSEALAPLAKTFADTANGHELMADFVRAGSRVMLGRGKDAVNQQTASDLANAMVMDRFNIQGNLRIPKSFDDRDVSQGASLILTNIGEHHIIPPQSYSGLKGDAQKVAFNQDLADYGYWNTNAKGDGASLYYQGTPVYESVKGRQTPVEISFSQLAHVGKQNRSAYENARRFLVAPATLDGSPVGNGPIERTVTRVPGLKSVDAR